mgnify:CR=1 FL=1
MNKVHNGCWIDVENISSIWSEIYADPKLDKSIYLVRVMFYNNSTILTIASFKTKKKADKLIRRIVRNEKII